MSDPAPTPESQLPADSREPREDVASGSDGAVPMRVPRHGRGRLNVGGNRGNRFGGGLKPSPFVRELARMLKKSKATEVLGEIVSGGIHELVGHDRDGEPIVSPTKNADRIAAIKLASSYTEGLPVARVEDVTPRPAGELTAEAVLDALPRILGAMAGGAAAKAKALEAVEADFEVLD